MLGKRPSREGRTRSAALFSFTTLVLVGLATPARAQQWGAPPPPAPFPPGPPPPPVRQDPPARVGFQMHIVPFAAVRIPVGKATGESGDSLAGRYAPQFPLEVGVGAKVTETIYVGGYVGTSFGTEGNDARLEAHCESGERVACSSRSFYGGVEGRYVFEAASTTPAWVGLGFGLTDAEEHISDGGAYSESVELLGLSLARLSGGIDYRFGRGFGLGVYGLVDVGSYFWTSTEVRGDRTFRGDVSSPAVHAWLGGGVRMVIFP